MRSLKFGVFCALLTFVVSLIPMKAMAIETGINWEKGVIRAIGLAAGKSGEKRVGLARAQARRAARMDAMRNLTETVEGVRVTGDSSMRDLELEYDIVKTGVDGLIKNINEVGEPKFYEDGTCEVILEMPIFGSSSSLAEVAFKPFKEEPKLPFPQPTSTTIVTTQITAVTGYTGLIVDCTGLNLNPVMSPVIKNDQGTAIYGHRNLDYDKVVAYGMASYAKNISEQTRAGNNPLIVKAVKLEDHDANPVISLADANAILMANENSKFLDSCSVVFIK